MQEGSGSKFSLQNLHEEKLTVYTLYQSILLPEDIIEKNKRSKTFSTFINIKTTS